MDLKKKYKWAIDLAKQHYEKVIIQEFDYGWALAMAVENERGEMRGIVLQRPLFEGAGGTRRFVDLYELHNTPKTIENLTNWLQTCFNTPCKVRKHKFGTRDG